MAVKIYRFTQKDDAKSVEDINRVRIVDISIRAIHITRTSAAGLAHVTCVVET